MLQELLTFQQPVWVIYFQICIYTENKIYWILLNICLNNTNEIFNVKVYLFNLSTIFLF